MNDFLKHGKRTWTYISVKAVHNSFPAIAVVLAIIGFPVASVIVLLAQIATGMVTDISFMGAMRREVVPSGMEQR